MEEFYFNMHVLDSTDIAIPIRTESGLTFQPTEQVASGVTIPATSICLLDYRSTAFIIATSKGNSRVAGDKIVGLLLTADHCMSDIFTGQLEFKIQDVSFSDDKSVHPILYARSLINFLKRNPTKSISSSTQQKYCVSNDIGLCLLLSSDDNISPGDFNKFILGQKEFDDNDPLIIVGYPLKISNNYCFPGFSNERLVQDTFCNLKKLIISTGRQFRYNDAIFEVKCSSTSGMSGFPCFARQNLNANECKLAGIYVGGPPLKEQYDIFQSHRSAFEHKSRRMLLNELQEKKRNISAKRVTKKIQCIIDQIVRGAVELKDLEPKVFEIARCIVSCSTEIQSLQDNYLFNTVIPFTHPVFENVIRSIELFNDLTSRNKSFLSIYEI